MKHYKVVLSFLLVLLGVLGLVAIAGAQDDTVAQSAPEQPPADVITLNEDAPNAPDVTWYCGDTLYSHSSSTNTPVWIDYSVVAGYTYFFRVYGKEYGSAIDPTLTLYAPDGTTVLATNDDYDGLDPLIHYTFTTSGTYKIKVEDIDGGSGRGAFYIYHDIPAYVSMAAGGTVGGVAYAAGDILRYSKCDNAWDMFLDVSQLGITGNTAGFAIEYGSYPTFLMSFAAKTNVPGMGKVPPQDIVRLYAYDVGYDTSGFFSSLFDGSDVGLTKASEAIDGIAIGEAGNMLVSLAGVGAVPKVKNIADEDLLRFRANQFGSTTAGTWDLYFDGSDVGLAGVDVEGVWKQGNTDDYFFSFDQAISGSGANAALGDMSVCRILSTGANTACSAWYNPPTFYAFDASAAGLTGVVDAVDMGGALAYLQILP